MAERGPAAACPRTVPCSPGARVLPPRRSALLAGTRLAGAALLGGVGLGALAIVTPDAAQAQTWIGTTPAWETATNWTPAVVPDGATTATFSTTGVNTVSINSGHTIDAIQFTANAPAYSITNNAGFSFNGAGILNSSSSTQNFTNVLSLSATITFNNSSTAGNVNITNNSTAVSGLTFNDTSNAGSATINNTGTTNFNVSSTAGIAQITNGSFLIFNNSADAGSATITNNSALIFNNSASANSASITSNSSLNFHNSTTAGSASITLQNSGSAVFTDTSSGGTAAFVVFAGSALDISPLTNGGTTAGSIAGSGNFFLGANKLTVGSLNTSTTVSGAIQDGGLGGGVGGALAKVGTGTFTLSGTNTYTGATTINAGTLSIQNASALGSTVAGTTVASGATLQLDGDPTAFGNSITVGEPLSLAGTGVGGNGALRNLTGNNTLTGAITLTADARIRTEAATQLTVTGQIGSAGGLEKSGTGTLVLTNANTYTGTTTVSAGVLNIRNAAALGTTAGGTTVANGATLQLQGGIAVGNEALSLAGAGFSGAGALENVSGNNSWSGPITLTADSTIGTSVGTDTLTLSGQIIGSGGLTKIGAGTLKLSGNNSYGGPTAINAGTLVAASGTALPSQTAATVNSGAKLAIANGVVAQVGSLADGLSGGGGVQIGFANPNTLLVVGGSASTTFSGTFAGAGSLELENAASLTLTGASNGGNIGTIGGDLSLCGCASGGLTINGGSLTVNGVSNGVSIFGGTLSVINGGTLNVGTTPTPSGSLLDASNMIVSGAGSTVTVAGLTGVGIFGPASLTIASGGVLNSQLGAEIDAGFGGTPTATVSGAGSTWNVGAPIGFFVGGGTTGGPGLLTISSGGVVNSAGAMTIGDSAGGTSTVTVTGSGSVLNALNSLAIGGPGCGCGVLVGTLIIADGGVVNSPGATSIGAGSTLNLGTGGLAGAIVTPAIDNAGLIAANFTDTLTLAATISDTGALSKAGTGTLILTGNNTYSGGTALNAGTLAVGSSGALGTGALTFAGGTTLQAAANGLSLANAMTLNGTDTVDTQSNALTLSGTLSGPGGLTKIGGGTLTLSGNNAYSGGTALNAGTLAVGSNLAIGTGSLTFADGTTLRAAGSGLTLGNAMTLNGTATFDTFGNSATLAGAISGPGGLTKSDIGNLTLTGPSTYLGPTNVLHDALVAGDTNVFSAASAFTVASGGALNLNGFSQTIGSLAGAGEVNNTNGATAATLTTGGDNTSTTFSGVIKDGGLAALALTKIGSGTLTLTGTDTYSGATTVNAGKLIVNGSIASSAVTVNSGGTLAGTGTVGATTIRSGGTFAPGNSPGTMTVAGNLAFQSGALFLVQVNPSASSSANVTAGGSAALAGSVQTLFVPGSYLTKS